MNDERTLLDIALGLHGYHTGASDSYASWCLGPEQEARDILALKDRLTNWHPSKCPFDDAVRQVLVEALHERGEWARETSGLTLSPNVRAAMREWSPADNDSPRWAIERASEIVGATVPQTGDPADTRNMLYALPAGLANRLTLEIAEAIYRAS